MYLSGIARSHGIFGHLFESQCHALFFLIDTEHDALDRIAFLDHFAGVIDLLGPAHIGHMQQPVDPFLDLDERPVVGQVAHLAVDHGSRRVLACDLRPGVLGELLEAQRDFLLVRIDFQDHHVDFLSHAQQLAGMVDSLGPAHFADMHEAFDAFFEFHERPVAHDIDHGALDHRVQRIAVHGAFPRAGTLLLEPPGRSSRVRDRY